MKNKTFVLAWVLLISEIVLAGTYSGGSGEPNDPYRIADANDLNALAANPSDWGKHFILTADIDLPTTTYTTAVVAPDMDNSNYRFDGIAFTGVFDGNGHRIINLTVDTRGSDTSYLALFGKVDSGAQVKNLGLENATVTGGCTSDSLGSLVGWNRGSITNCYSTASVSGGDDSGLLGGLVGRNNGTITNCYSTASVAGRDGLGGLVGGNKGSIGNCYSTGSVTGGDDLGGLVGVNYYGGSISDCYSTGSATGGEDSEELGGLAGKNDGTISNCYSTGAVTGGNHSRYLGGLVGWNWYGSINNCYSTGEVSGGNHSSCLGGLAGENVGGAISNCYSTAAIAGGDNSYRLGGLVGIGPSSVVTNSFWDKQTSGQPTSAGGKGKTTAQMQTASTFVGWNGCGKVIWTLDEGSDYPRLFWEHEPGEPLPTEQLSDYVIGEGTKSDPYLIYTAEELNVIGLFICAWDKHFRLMADIDLGGFSGTELNMIGSGSGFSGAFDGNGHRIINLTINSGGVAAGYPRLFGKIASGGQVKNLGLEDVTVTGGLVGVNCGSIENCYSTGAVIGGGGLGGLVQYNEEGTISNCYSTASVTGADWSDDLGGLVGVNWYGSISNCYSTGAVTGGNDSYCLGGLVGDNVGEISNCYSTGAVTAGDYSWYLGGLVGYNHEGRISNCFWDTATSGEDTSDGGEGKTTAQMKRQSTFTEAGWDFVEIWAIGENQTYPFLRTHTAGDINHDASVNLVDLAIMADHWLEGTQ